MQAELTSNEPRTVRKPVGWGMVEFSTGLKVGPIRIYRDVDGTLDTKFTIVDVKLSAEKER
jgi:hypothetical protein